MSTYEVTGRLAYRQHAPGERFEATLDAETEARAVKRGAVRVIDPSPVRLQPGTFRLPDGQTKEH